MKPIDEFLRQQRPQVQDDPAFLLKVQQKMRAVEDIKAEVDRQRKTGRWAIAAALVFGLLLGTLATLAAYCLPQVLAGSLPQVLADGLPQVLADGLPQVLADGLPHVLADGLPQVLADGPPQVLAGGPGEDCIARLRSFLQTWRLLLPLPVAACAITLGLLATRRVRE